MLLLVDVRGQLAHLVEDDDGVIERVTQNRQEADHGRGRDLDLQDREHADGHGDVVHQREQRRRSHAPRAEVHRHQQSNERHEDDERLSGLSGDRGTPGGADRGGLHLGHIDAVGAGQRVTHLSGLRGIQGRRLDSDRVRAHASHLRGALNEAGRGHCTRGERLALVAHVSDIELRASGELN